MSIFLSTADGKVLLADIDARRTEPMADFEGALTDIAVSGDGTLFGASDSLVQRLDLVGRTRAPVLLVPEGDIVGIDVDGSGRLLVGRADGQVLRQEADGTLSDIGRFDGGIEGGLARIGGFAYAATGHGDVAVMNILTGAVTVLRAHGLGRIGSVSADSGLVRLSATPVSGTPQFFLFDPRDLSLSHEAGLLGFYDRLTGAASGDIAPVVFTGGGGDEELIGTALADALQAEAGDDRVYGGGGPDSLEGGDGADLLLGEDGNDRLLGGTGDDLLVGGAGLDWVLFHGAAPVAVDLQTAGPQTTGQGIDRLVGIEALEGSDADDILRGDARRNILVGGHGDDTVIGRGGDDNLRGEAGDDLLRPGDGNDTVKGGDGFDIVDYSDAGAAVTVKLGLDRGQPTGGSGTDRLFDIEGVAGSDHADDLLGTPGQDWLEGRGGDDSLQGGGSRDTLYGQGGDDDLRGGGGYDVLRGGAGDDRLDGGRGLAGTLASGGDGADSFVFVANGAGGRGDGMLQITDFDMAAGDRVVLIGTDPADFANWTVSASGGGGAQVTFPSGAVIVFDDIDPGQIAADWFV